MHLRIALLAAALLGLTDAGSPPVYKVDLAISSGTVEKPQPTTHYTMLVDESRKAVFQAISRADFGNISPPYVDAGTSIELTVRDAAGKVNLDGVIDVTAITGEVYIGALREPIIAHRKLAFHTDMELEKTTEIRNDHPDYSMRKVEIAVTRVN